MKKVIQSVTAAVVGFCLVASSAMSQQAVRIEGIWKLTSFHVEDVQSKERVNIYGEQPWGYMQVMGNGRFFAWAHTRLPGPAQSVWEDVAQSIGGQETPDRAIFYAGKYRVEGSNLVVHVDQALNEGWIGAAPFDLTWTEGRSAKEEVRKFQIESGANDDDTLTIETLPMTNPNGAGNTIVGRVSWQRVFE